MSNEVQGTQRCLARSKNYSVWADYEAVIIRDVKGTTWAVDEMYGNPQATIITWDERYAVVVGCGIMICDLMRFGEKTGNGKTWKTTSVISLMSDPGDTWWFALIEQVFQDEDRIEIRLATDLMDPHIGIYSLNPETFELHPVSHGQAIP